MDELDLFEAIGNVDEELLLEYPRRITTLRKMGLIAAVLTLAVLTACAAPVVLRTFQAVAGGEVELVREAYMDRVLIFDRETGDIIGASGSREWHPAEYEITLDITAEAERPDSLEELYAPAWVPEDYVNFYDRSEENCRILRYSTGDRNGIFGNYVIFRQSLLPQGNPVVFTDSLSEFREVFVNAMASSYETYGEATVLELCPRLKDMGDFPLTEELLLEARRYLYWSDGAYLFRLTIPYEMDDQTVTQIIESVTADQTP